MPEHVTAVYPESAPSVGQTTRSHQQISTIGVATEPPEPARKRPRERPDESKAVLAWGYYCETCGISLEPCGDIHEACMSAAAMGVARPPARHDPEETLPTVGGRVAVFLMRHKGHSLWIECDFGVLRLSPEGAPPHGRPPALPGFARASGPPAGWWSE